MAIITAVVGLALLLTGLWAMLIRARHGGLRTWVAGFITFALGYGALVAGTISIFRS